MTKHLIASLVAIGLIAGPAAAAANTTTKAPVEKSKTHKAHTNSKKGSKGESKTPKSN